MQACVTTAAPTLVDTEWQDAAGAEERTSPPTEVATATQDGPLTSRHPDWPSSRCAGPEWAKPNKRSPVALSAER
jgi:hypothetical protein